MAKRTSSRKVRLSVSSRTELANDAENGHLTPLNFKVSRDFHREFKTFAAQHSKTMVGILQEAFALLKDMYGKQQ